jgi:hypothetical protein
MISLNYSPYYGEDYICAIICGQKTSQNKPHEKCTTGEHSMLLSPGLRSALRLSINKGIVNCYKCNISRSEYTEDLSDAKVLEVPEEALFLHNVIVSGKFVNAFVLHKETFLLYQVKWKLRDNY